MIKANKKMICAVAVTVCVVTASVFGVVYANKGDDKKETVSKETTVTKGNLTTGVTESGSVEIGTVTQSFELEPVSVSGSGSSNSSGSSSGGSSSGSASSGNSSSGSSASGNSSNGSGASQGGSSAGGAGGSTHGSTGSGSSSNANGTKSMSTGTATSGSVTATATASGTASPSTNSSSSSFSNSSALVVEGLKVTTGQVVQEGDAILSVTSDSLAAYKKELQSTVDTATLALQQAKLERDQAKVSAEYEYKSNKQLGTTAKAEYQATLNKLSKAVSDAQTAIKNADTQISSLSSQIKKLKSTLSTYNTQYKSATDAAKKNELSQKISSVKEQISSLETQYDSVKNNYSTLTSNLNAAQRNQTTDSITAKQTYETSMLTYNNADSLYQIAIDGIDNGVTSAQETLDAAKQVLSDFESYVGDGTIKATTSGTVMTVGYSAGDELSTETAIATYSNAKSVTMTVSVSQEDISVVKVGDTVQVTFTAYEGEYYTATVSKIETAKNNSSTVSYNVTVTLSGDVAKIYTGMTGSVTFITKEVKDILYVSNKAVTTEGTKSYVVKSENGVKTKTEVVTGFSDGISVEIVSGLKEGDTVIIESQVNLS